MQIDELEIPGLLLVTPKRFGDARGFFSETFRSDMFDAHDAAIRFVQDNHAFSRQKGVLRGLHFQIAPHAQGKLVRCSRGAILDVGVDIRSGSPTYGKYVAVELSSDNWRQLWVPPGFAHGYVTLEDNCEVIYKVTDFYAPDCDRGIAWNDPDIGIDWKMPVSEVTLSDKDQRQPRLSELGAVFQF